MRTRIVSIHVILNFTTVTDYKCSLLIRFWG